MQISLYFPPLKILLFSLNHIHKLMARLYSSHTKTPVFALSRFHCLLLLILFLLVYYSLRTDTTATLLLGDASQASFPYKYSILESVSHCFRLFISLF